MQTVLTTFASPMLTKAGQEIAVVFDTTDRLALIRQGADTVEIPVEDLPAFLARLKTVAKTTKAGK